MSAQPWTGGSITGLFGGWAGQLASDPMQGGEWGACSSCSRPTRMTGTKLCDRCWERQRNADPGKVEVPIELLRRVSDALPGGHWVAQLRADVSALLESAAGPKTEQARHEAEPWPLADVLARLCAAADHLLGHHNCDCHGYEELVAARDAARRWGGKS